MFISLIRSGPRGDRRDAGQRLEGDGARGKAVGLGHQGREPRAVGGQLHNKLKTAEKKVGIDFRLLDTQ